MATMNAISRIFGRNDEKDLGPSLMALLGFGAVTALAGAVGAYFGPDRRPYKRYYRRLDKPAWTPPNIAFPIAWTTSYALSALSAWRVWRAKDSPDRTRALSLWWAQIGANAAWPALFYGLRSPKAGLADMEFYTAALTAYTATAGKVDKLAAVLSAPTLAWTAFANALNMEIVRRNKDR